MTSLTSDVQGTYAETQKVAAVRKIFQVANLSTITALLILFQRALGVPLLCIEQVWKEYNIFENVSLSGGQVRALFK